MLGFSTLTWTPPGEARRYVARDEYWVHSVICDSPLEAAFAEALLAADDMRNYKVGSQYKLGPYRYDFAVFFKGAEIPAVLIECDGVAYHFTPEQIANDVRKTELARKHGIKLLRFRGTDIYRKSSLCVDDVLRTLEGIASAK